MSSQRVIKAPARKTPSNDSSSGNPVRQDAADTPNKGDSKRNNDREGDQDRYGHPKKGQQQIPNHQHDHQLSTATAFVLRPASPPGTAEPSTPILISRPARPTERPASRQLHGTSTYGNAASDTSGLHAQHHVTRSKTVADAIEILEEHALTANDERQARNFAIVAQLAEWAQDGDHKLMTAALRPARPDVEKAYRTRLARIGRKADPSNISREPFLQTVPTSIPRLPARALQRSEHSEHPGPLKRAAEDDEEDEKESQDESEVELEELSDEDSDEDSAHYEDALENTHPVDSPLRRPSPPGQPTFHHITTSATSISPTPRPFPTRPEKEPKLRDQHYEHGNPRTGPPPPESVPRSERRPTGTANPVPQANLPQGSGRSQLHSRATQDPTARYSQQETLPRRGRG